MAPTNAGVDAGTMALVRATDAMLTAMDGRLYDQSFSFPILAGEKLTEPEGVADRYDAAFGHKELMRCGRDMTWSSWLVNGIFPLLLYRELGQSLIRLNADPRTAEAPSYAARDAWASFFGRAFCQDRGQPRTMLQYLLGRLRVPMHRGMPHFYFPVEDAAWVFDPLIRNMNLLKTGRTSVACMMAWTFKWDNRAKALRMTMIMRSNQWSHLYGDIFGGRAALLAILKASKLPRGVVTVYAPSYHMDYPKAARRFLESL